jgi:hypothetical protein
MRVFARVHQPDRHHRDAEIARLFEEVAGDDGAAVAVEGQRLMERERRRRRHDWRHVGRGGAPGPPRVGSRPHEVERGDGFVVETPKLRIRRGVLEPIRFDEMQQQDRIVIREAPQRIVQIAKYVAGLGVPAPPQIVRELVQAADSRGQRRQRHVAVHQAIVASAFRRNESKVSSFTPSGASTRTFARKHPSLRG